MANKKNTRRALFTSIMALILCCAMLVGTTFAWFTDSVTSTNNRIQSGTLDIALEMWDGTQWTDVSETSEPIFEYDKWEPGYTQIVHLRVINKGTLHLKWQAKMNTTNQLSALADVINVYVKSDDQADTVKAAIEAINARPSAAPDAYAEPNFHKFTLSQFAGNLTAMTQGVMAPAQESYLSLVLEMDPSAGNEYQNMDLGGIFDLVIEATQNTVEVDSFDSKYDQSAAYGDQPVHGVGSEMVNGLPKVYVEARDIVTGTKVGSFSIPAEAVADVDKPIEVSVVPTTLDATVDVQDNQDAQSFDVEVKNLKEGTGAEIEVSLRVGTGLSGVKVFHNDKEITDPKPTYDEITGYVSFVTTSFSPYTVVYDAEYVAPDVDDKEKLPTAKVEELEVEEQEMYIVTDIASGFGAGENMMIKPAVAYTFVPDQTPEDVTHSFYKNWNVDYYVSMDEYVEEGVILVGNYQNWDADTWYGFMVPAGTYTTPVALLGTMTGGVSNWSYEDIVNGVELFSCGAYNSNEANVGKTMTVQLRLIDPENSDNTIVVEEIMYTF